MYVVSVFMFIARLTLAVAGVFESEGSGSGKSGGRSRLGSGTAAGSPKTAGAGTASGAAGSSIATGPGLPGSGTGSLGSAALSSTAASGVGTSSAAGAGTAAAGTGLSGSGSSSSTAYDDGFYSFNLTQCPVCSIRRSRHLWSDANGAVPLSIEKFLPPSAAQIRAADMSQGAASTGDGSSAGAGSGNLAGRSAGGGSSGGGSGSGTGKGSRSSSSYLTSSGEDGSFNDGFAIYARFFKPMGITVDRAGRTVWVADFGNNRVRNITCSGQLFPTFQPTDVPTPAPSAEPTEQPTRPSNYVGKSKGSKVGGKVGKGGAPGKGKNALNRNIKAGKSARSAGVGDVGELMSQLSSGSGLSSGVLAAVGVASVLLAAAGLWLLYYRRQLSSMVSIASKAADVSLGAVGIPSEGLARNA